MKRADLHAGMAVRYRDAYRPEGERAEVLSTTFGSFAGTLTASNGDVIQVPAGLDPIVYLVGRRAIRGTGRNAVEPWDDYVARKWHRQLRSALYAAVRVGQPVAVLDADAAADPRTVTGPGALRDTRAVDRWQKANVEGDEWLPERAVLRLADGSTVRAGALPMWSVWPLERVEWAQRQAEKERAEAADRTTRRATVAAALRVDEAALVVGTPSVAGRWAYDERPEAGTGPIVGGIGPEPALILLTPAQLLGLLELAQRDPGWVELVASEVALSTLGGMIGGVA